MIDREHSTVLPLLLHCGIPDSVQNYGDQVSEYLQAPTMPDNSSELNEREQVEQVELFRRRQLHYLYIHLTGKITPEHYDALTSETNTLRRRVFFHHANDPWEGDNTTLKAELIPLCKTWPQLDHNGSQSCPISHPDDESDECLRLAQAQAEANDQLRVCQDVIEVGSERWVPLSQYEEERRREKS